LIKNNFKKSNSTSSLAVIISKGDTSKMKFLVFLIGLILSAYSNAAWIDTSGKVTSIITYAHTDTIIVNISAVGTDVTECSNKASFVISKSIGSEARTRMYSMLLSAQATGRTVVLAYNNTGGCEPWDANANAYRKIVRLR